MLLADVGDGMDDVDVLEVGEYGFEFVSVVTA